jgi:hypothetical protein
MLLYVITELLIHSTFDSPEVLFIFLGLSKEKFLTPRYVAQRGVDFSTVCGRLYLREFETEFENILGC